MFVVNLFLEQITETLEERKAGIKIGGRVINNLRFAEDIYVLTETEEDLDNSLRN